jgi:predicted component of type VI protein secretion system
LKAAEVPETRLGQARLGWTSWLKAAEFTTDDSQACIRMA